MEEKFVQKTVLLDPERGSGKIKVEKLWELVEAHPYKEAIYEAFDIEKIKNEIICIDFIDTVYEKIKSYNEKYKRYSILAQVKDINVYQEEKLVEGQLENNIIFHFEEYVDVDEIKYDMKAIAKYDSKNTYFEEYSMTKFANYLFDKRQSRLVNYNIQHFKNLARNSEEFNKHRSYRLVENDGVFFLRGITSTKYCEYGVDFTFVISMLILHSNMKLNKGLEYRIKNVSLNESKLEIIVSEKHLKDAGVFGSVSTAIKISTNDLGQGSLNFVNIINIGQINSNGFYLYPSNEKLEDSKLIITHTTKPENVLGLLKDMDSILNTSDNFIKELHEVKTIKNPDELRIKILSKIESKRSSLKKIKTLSDIFGKKIDNEISNFAKLLEMCNKAEELDIEFDLKDKLRYIISDVLLYGATKL